MRTFVLLALLSCDDPTPEPAIEITGYLDAARVSWTTVGDEAQAAGRDGAAEPGAVVTLSNGTDEGAATVGDGGAFVVTVPATEGDALALTSGDDEVAHVVPAHPPFPDHDHVSVHVDPAHPGTVLVEVGLVAPRTDGVVWVTDPDDGRVVLLEVHDAGRLHAGQLDCEAGDVLRLHWVPDDGVESVAIEAPVTP